MSAVVRLAAILWASPASVLGLIVGAAALASGGRVRRRDGVLEFWGGAATWLLSRGTPLEQGAAAMTLGHVVLGFSRAALDISHRHEMVHVAQYQRWGPLFIPAYLLCSLVLWLRGKNAYWDNPFEREAYRQAGPWGE